MIVPVILFALIGSSQYRAVTTASIDYEPIKITVNENFNGLPGQVTQGFSSLDPGFIHQGANFYFKPQVNLPSGYFPPNIEALISSIHKKPCLKDSSEILEEKIIEVIKPQDKPSIVAVPEDSNIIVEGKIPHVSTPTEIIVRGDLELPPPPPPLLVPAEIDIETGSVIQDHEPVIVAMPEETPIKEVFVESEIPHISMPTEIIVKEELELPPPPPPLVVSTVVDDEPELGTPEVMVIPDAPELPPLDVMPQFEETKIKEVFVEEKIHDIAMPNEIVVRGDLELPPPPPLLLVPAEMNIETESVIQDHEPVIVAVPEETEIKEVFVESEIPHISIPTEMIIKEELELPPPPPPLVVSTVIADEPELVTSEVMGIPEAPELPPLNVIPQFEETKIKEVFVEENIHHVTLPNEVVVRGDLELPPPPPPLLVPAEIHIETESVIQDQEPVIVPVPEETKIKEVFLESEIPRISIPTEMIIKEELELPPPPPPLVVSTVIADEPELVTSEVMGIPEAPELPPLNVIPQVIEELKIEEPVLSETSIRIPTVVIEEVKEEEPVVVKESTEVFSPLAIPSAPTLGPFVVPELSESILLENNTPVVFEEEKVKSVEVLPIVLENQPHVVFEEEKEDTIAVFPSIVKVPPGPTLGPLVEPEPLDSVALENHFPYVLDGVKKDSIAIFPPFNEVSPRLVLETINKPDIRNSFILEKSPPVVLEKVKEEERVVFEKSIKMLPQIRKISLNPIAAPKLSNSFVSKSFSKQNACPNCVIAVKRNFRPVNKSTKRIGLFSKVPFISEFSTQEPSFKVNEAMFSGLGTVKNFLFRKHPFRFPLSPFPRLPSNAVIIPKTKDSNNNILHSTSFAHNIFNSRVAPHITLKKKTPNIDIRSSFPNISS